MQRGPFANRCGVGGMTRFCPFSQAAEVPMRTDVYGNHYGLQTGACVCGADGRGRWGGRESSSGLFVPSQVTKATRLHKAPSVCVCVRRGRAGGGGGFVWLVGSEPNLWPRLQYIMSSSTIKKRRRHISHTWGRNYYTPNTFWVD